MIPETAAPRADLAGILSCAALLMLLLATLSLPQRVAAGRATTLSCSASEPTTAGVRRPATVSTIEEAYSCLLTHYPSGPALDDRLLLRGAMQELIAALTRRGLDQSNAILPALPGTRTGDWEAFQRSYLAIIARLPPNRAIREDIARAAINGLVDSLHDDHTNYAVPAQSAGSAAADRSPGPVGSGDFGFGLRFSSETALRAGVSAPLFVVAVDAGSPAARAGVRPGDIVTAINGSAPFIQGVADLAVVGALEGSRMLRLRLNRPTTGRSLLVTLTPGPYASPQPVTARVIGNAIAYLQLSSFVDNAANYLFAALDGLGLGRRLRGVVLDLRGNGGGSAGEPARLLGAFVHHRIFAYFDNGRGHLSPAYTDGTMPLLHVPVVMLIDGGCASACDVTAAAFHDLHLGRLLGARTAGDASGPSRAWFLEDDSILRIPVAFMRGVQREIVDGIGVPPDQYVPISALDLSSGHDPVVDQALRYFQ